MIRAGVLVLSLLTVSTPAWSPPIECAPPLVRVTDPRFVAPEPYRADVIRYAARYGIPLDIAVRLAYEESQWKPTLISRNRNRTYDHGLYQLNSAYHRVKLPWANIRDGLAYLAQCYRATGTWRKAVAAYQAGIDGARKSPWKGAREAARVVLGGIE
jgi:soluble lytic murein transglycosylase-like protein